jgi:hypothetical protein
MRTLIACMIVIVLIHLSSALSAQREVGPKDDASRGKAHKACDVHGKSLDLQSGYDYKDLRIATYHSCNGLTVRDFNVQVIWGDNGENQDPNTHPKVLADSVLGGSHTYKPVQQPTDYVIRVSVHAACVEAGHPDWPDDCPSRPEGTSNNHNGVAHVYPAMPPKALTLNPSSIPAGTSSSPYEGIVDLFGPAPASGMIVALTSSDPVHVIVPAELRIPAGLSSASFPFSTQNAAQGSVRISVTNAGKTRTADLIIN